MKTSPAGRKSPAGLVFSITLYVSAPDTLGEAQERSGIKMRFHWYFFVSISKLLSVIRPLAQSSYIFLLFFFFSMFLLLSVYSVSPFVRMISA